MSYNMYYEESPVPVIKAINSYGTTFVGIRGKESTVLQDIIASNEDCALYQDKKIIGYIKDGKVIWL